MAWRMKADSQVEPTVKAGTKVYRCAKHDYGMAYDDTRMSGRPHWSMTLDPDGDYPFFTVPVDDLEPWEGA